MIGRLALAGVLVLVGCLSKKGVTEQVSPDFKTSKFSSVVVIAGDDGRTDLRVSSRVRQMMNEHGLTAVRRSGRWGTEVEALEDICPTGQSASVDGVVFVSYNQLTLYDCRTHRRAYQINGGDEIGIDALTKKFVAYVQQAPASAVSN